MNKEPKIEQISSPKNGTTASRLCMASWAMNLFHSRAHGEVEVQEH
jgi:hypothetical protein